MNSVKLLTKQEIIDIFKNFNENYHQSYLETYIRRLNYFIKCDDGSLNDLVNKFAQTLKVWGAGRRKAPKINSNCNIKHFITKNHKIIYMLSTCRNEVIKNYKNEIYILLNEASKFVFQNNKRLTYPTKAILLLTGKFPAYDSNFKNGLKKVGIDRVKNENICHNQSIDAYINVSECCYEIYKRNFTQIGSALANTKYSYLLSEPGRIIDILLFQLGKLNK